MNIDKPIITSILDTDYYKITMGDVVFRYFSNTKVRYTFINRNKTPFPDGFAEKLINQIDFLAGNKMSLKEYNWLNLLSSIPISNYTTFLYNYKFDPNEVKINQSGGDLSIIIEGYWYRTIFWEVPLMAIISELYFKMTEVKIASDWYDRIIDKSSQLSENECLWSDFGTRRRFSKEVQFSVVNTMKNYKGFIGTSNPYFAYINNIRPIGTFAHEGPMALQVLYNDPFIANQTWCDTWLNHYNYHFSYILTDTFTTDIFLEHCRRTCIQLLDGFRQDSGCPYVWAEKIIGYFYKNDIAYRLKDKTFIFSDNLTVPRFINISKEYRNIVKKVIGGIGTNLTNDVFTEEQKNTGIKPLNIVIKLSEVKVNDKWIGTVKLSDDEGKYTGKPEDINRVKKILGLK